MAAAVSDSCPGELYCRALLAPRLATTGPGMIVVRVMSDLQLGLDVVKAKGNLIETLESTDESVTVRSAAGTGAGFVACLALGRDRPQYRQ
ncbi:hypothetical protein P3H15_32210 [Rhodococcus sp. T2V]|uniref:hypothetical protein n=1 Tax=Rhodococcus sp. T2V TaxID=3034164 RepID=UPI0023E0AC71|nr:hypothetical protein [Rhodococcus sp. T2V]MDF3309684.1 hypothetical protein [Rhodococcus sp. T2V]